MRRFVGSVLFVTAVVVGVGAGMAPAQATGGADTFPATQIAASLYHTCAVVSNGTAACWGYGHYGALGTGNNADSNIPVAVTGGALANKTITQIDTGWFRTCALISDGTVACWGRNNNGQLGTGNNIDSNTPVAVTGGALAGKTVTQIAAETDHACALISDGTVACWGLNSNGQLGTGDYNNSNIPVAITGDALAGKTVNQITAGFNRTCAVVSDGTVACWGGGDSYTPVAVTGGALANKTVTQVTAGGGHMCALISDGTVACWGSNTEGQLGTGDDNNSSTPVAANVGALAGKTVTEISAGQYHTCALISNGTVSCWGYNQSGQIGNGNTNNTNTPVAITSGALTNKTVTQITAGYNYTCALISDGTVACWGDNSGGVLGTGDEIDSNSPAMVARGEITKITVTQISGQLYHTCALLSNGTAACWGIGSEAPLGTGNTMSSYTPVAITGGALANKTITQIYAGYNHTCAVVSDGTVACWGRNNNGQLGTGNNIDSNTPVVVTGGALTNKYVTQITAGDLHTCALISDGTVACWGLNSSGQLGTGDTNSSNIPVAITGGALENKTVIQITAEAGRTCALISDGTVACWGGGASYAPVAVTGGSLAGTTVTQVTAGFSHVCALISDGTVACWGSNIEGQLGTGDYNNSGTPVAVTGGALANNTVTEITAGGYHTCALISNGTISCWGFNQNGQIGNGNTNTTNTPIAITGGALTNKTVTDISGHQNYSCAVVSDGTSACWGANTGGVLGTGDDVHSNSPVATVGWPERALNTSAPTISGNAQVGQTLTANDGTWTGTPTPTFTYQWYTCTAKITSATQTVPGTCSEISATENTLELTSTHAGKYMAVEVTGTSDGTDPVSWLAISTTTTVKMRAANTVRPTVKGQARVGKRLTAKKGAWTGFPTPSFTYKWYACTAKVGPPTQTIPRKCQLIAGATKATFKLTSAQKNKFIAVQVTGRSRGTTATSWLSKTSAKVR